MNFISRIIKSINAMRERAYTRSTGRKSYSNKYY